MAMPLIAEFQWTREIEDRLLAPIDVAWLAIEKVIAGMLQALVAGLVVLPLAWLVLGRGVQISIGYPVDFRRDDSAGRGFFRLRRTGSGMQHRSAAYRADVQHGHDADDFFRLHVLSVERAENFSDPAENRAHQSAGVCQRRIARDAGSAVSAFIDRRRCCLRCFSSTFCCWLWDCGSSRRRR